MPEPIFEQGVDVGDPRQPGFYFSLSTYDMDDEALTLLRDQAAAMVQQQSGSGRTLVVNTFTAIRDLAERGLRRDRHSSFLVRVAIDPTDPLSHVVDARARIMAHALRFAEESEHSKVAAFWKGMASSWGTLHFTDDNPRPGGITW